MNGVKALLAAAGLASAFISGSAAEATTLKFVMSGDDNYTWTMDSDPSPFQSAPSLFTRIDAGPTGFLEFSATGGISATIADPVFPHILFSYAGPKLYSNDEAAPHFSVGKFVMTFNTHTNSAANETLTISVAATPLPAALPLFVSALGGLGFLGWRRRTVSSAR